MTRAREHGVAGREKASFPTRKEALRALASWVHRTGANMTGYEVYRCRFCGAHHYGHKRRRRFNR